MKSIKLLLCLCFILSFQNLQSQSFDKPKKEIGLRAISLTNFNLIYKTETDLGNYWRFGLGNVQFSQNSTTNGDFSQFNLVFAAGYEKRRDITDRLEFIHGFQPTLGFSLNNEFQQYQIGLAYILGTQYSLNRDFTIGLELAPSLLYRYSDNNQNLLFNAGGSPVWLFIVHKF